jgi:hypothetical protein
MTTFAGGGYVPASQRKARLAMVKAIDAPGNVAVTIITSFSCLALVFVVFFVTTVAIQRGFAETLKVFVAGNTFHLGLGMRVFQRELGLVVKEAASCCFPVNFQVAVTAFFAQRQVVFVVLFMAGVAV